MVDKNDIKKGTILSNGKLNRSYIVVHKTITHIMMMPYIKESQAIHPFHFCVWSVKKINSNLYYIDGKIKLNGMLFERMDDQNEINILYGQN